MLYCTDHDDVDDVVGPVLLVLPPHLRAWSNTGQTRVKRWSKSGQRVVKVWSNWLCRRTCPGASPPDCYVVKHWSNTGQKLVKHWSNSGVKEWLCRRTCPHGGISRPPRARQLAAWWCIALDAIPARIDTLLLHHALAASWRHGASRTSAACRCAAEDGTTL